MNSRDRGPRTLKVLFALARGGTNIVTPDWVYACQRQVSWVDPARFLAGFGPPRPRGANLLRGRKLHVVAASLGASDPARAALVALISAAGGKVTAQRAASMALVGDGFSIARAGPGIKALAKKHAVVRTLWLFDLIEEGDPALPTRNYVV